MLSDAQSAVDNLADSVSTLSSPAAKPVANAAPPTPAVVAPNTAPLPDRIQNILKLRVPLLVRLAHRDMTISEITQLAPGTILEFERTVDQELDLMINNCQIGTGVAVKVNESFGLRITQIGDLKQRIDSLGTS